MLRSAPPVGVVRLMKSKTLPSFNPYSASRCTFLVLSK